MFRELQILVLCGPVQGGGCERRLAGELGQSLGVSLLLLRHAVGTCPTGFWALRAPRDAEMVPVECAGNSGHVVWATEMALRAGLGFHPGGELETVSANQAGLSQMRWCHLGIEEHVELQ